jgi:hypothetical protein
MLGILGTLIVAELVHRPIREHLAASFSRSLRCAALGAGFVLIWVLFLAVTGTLAGFVAYYQTTVSGHELWGAYSPQWSLTGDPWTTIEFALPVALFLLTIWKVVVKLRRRTPWRTIEWVIVASSTPVILFYQVVLDRMDPGHVNEVFQTLIPFVVLWAIELVRMADGLVTSRGAWLLRRWKLANHFPLTVPVTILAVIAIALGSPTSLSSLKNLPGAFHPAVPVSVPTGLPLGYTQPGVIDIAQIQDLGKVLDRYAGRNGPVFDFTNEMGITYFLLDRVPGARFYHVESAQTASAQQLEISDLERSRPRVVIFNDETFGLPDYDGIWSMERNYLVSQYILDHYRPLLDTHGQLIMLRDDLVSQAQAQPLPQLTETPVTTGLYFDMPSCDWGYVPNFLIHPASGANKGGLVLAAHDTGKVTLITMTGWAFDSLDGQPAQQVLVMSDGKEVASVVPGLPRPDVAAALHVAAATDSGFQLEFSVADGAPYQIYVLDADGAVTPLSPSTTHSGLSELPSSITTSDGVVHTVRSSPSGGSIDSTSMSTGTRSFVVHVPAGINLSSYQWMEMGSPSGFGRSRIQMTDNLGGGPSHIIALSTLASVGDSVYTRVGSCLQWHGYNSSNLTLLVHGPPTTRTVRLLR